jgi:alpha-2-macroglobulin
MIPGRVVGLALITTALQGNTADDLRVLRHSPDREGSATSIILVTFDRPVAEELDRAPPAKGIITVEPPVEGTAEWRDPVTLRFTPATLLPSDREYTVTVRNTWATEAGDRLPEPYRFGFRVAGPRVLTSSIAGVGDAAGYLDTRARFTLLVSGPGDYQALARATYLELGTTCGGDRVARFTLGGDREVANTDPWEFRRWSFDDDAEERRDLRRVVTLAPERPLPRDCPGVLVAPRQIGTRAATPPHRWPFHTYGPLRLASARCGQGEPFCATGPLHLRFTTPVRGSALAAALRLTPAVPVTWSDTAQERAEWWVTATLKPRTPHVVVLDSALADVYGQRLGPQPGTIVTTTGFAPSVTYLAGRVLVERSALRSLTVSYLNVDTLVAEFTPIPDSALVSFLARPWGHEELLADLKPLRTDTLVVPSQADRGGRVGLRLPVFNAQGPGAPGLLAVRVQGLALRHRPGSAPVALVQVTDLAVHTRLGAGEGVVWVVGAGDGRPRPGARVTLVDAKGDSRAQANTDEQGLARFSIAAVPAASAGAEEVEQSDWYLRSFYGYVNVVLGNDRAIVSVSESDWELDPWRFNVAGAWGTERHPVAAALFAERGIYRPGETVHVKAILRRGALGALAVPAAGDSLRLVFADREGGELASRSHALTEFGTAADTLVLGPALPLGTYAVRAEARVDGSWQGLATATYRVAEYRPPEFLADLRTEDSSALVGDTVGATAEGRYLFGAPMAGAAVRWTAARSTVWPWELQLPNTEGFTFAEARWWWEEPSSFPEVFAEGADSLDAAGALRFRVPLPPSPKGQAYRAALTATVTDVNRQTSSASGGVLVHPAAFYLGVKPVGDAYFWRAGEPREVEVIAARPDGVRLANVAASGVLIRREWHRVRRERGGYSEIVGEWVSDTVARCAITTTAAAPARCRVTPPQGGQYTFRIAAADPAGRGVAAGFYRWATGPDWIPWFDESQLKMDVVPERERYEVGDTARVLFASPFTDAEAWVTVEREGLIEQRRLKIGSGATTLAFPVTEAWAPNAFVSIIVSRGRIEPPGKPDDPGRPQMRVGYAELRVEPRVKRLSVAVTSVRDEYRPGDTARMHLAVRDAAGRGTRSEVTLWAVDEGILALTGYKTPDPLALLYRARGLGMRLASNLVAVVPQVNDSGIVSLEKGRAPGGGGGDELAATLRSRFASTAFFLGSVVTDAEGAAEAAARLPDNLTTFRLMAVAVTPGDRYGSGESKVLVTRPLLARPALPRFVRAGDRLEAGAVVNHRLGQSAAVTVETQSTGIRLAGERRRQVTLDRGRGQEVRFPFEALPGDSAVFRFRVQSGREGDAVEARIPIKPAYHVRAHTVAGVLVDTATAVFALPAGTDLAASRLEVSLGASPLAAIRALDRKIRVYPYYCSEQVTSAARPLIALLRAARDLDDSTLAPRTAARDVAEAVRTLLRRQRSDGGIGYWGVEDWSSPWLSGYAGLVLLDARELGLAVPDSAIERLTDYLRRSLRQPVAQYAWLVTYYGDERVSFSEQIAAVDFLARVGAPDVAAENRLLAVAARLGLANRARLAEVLARGGRPRDARRLLEPIWAATRVEGRRAVLPDTALRDYWFYFPSATRAPSHLLAATVAVDPAHPLIGPLVETLIGAARVKGWWWTTVDVGAAVPTLASLERVRSAAGDRGVRLMVGDRELRLGSDSLLSLDAPGLRPGLARPGSAGAGLAVHLEAVRAGPPVFFALTVHEVPSGQPTTPDDAGISVERWYERLDARTPVTSVAAGEMVRVWLRLTVKADRQFVVLDDPLPAGLEAVDVSLRTQGEIPGVEADRSGRGPEPQPDADYGIWYGRWWSPFAHRELRDDRVVYAAPRLRPGRYYATYVARATTPGTFVKPPAHAEEMYNPAVHGRTEGGTFTVTAPAR